MLDLLAFPDDSRIWIYASDKIIPDKQVSEIHNSIQEFTKSWQSHQQDLAATGGILHNHFIILVVNENKNSPGGCSIDKSIHYVQSLGHKYSVDFFNRMVFHYLENEEVKTIRMDEMKDAYENNKINDSTLFFDNLTHRKIDFIKDWLKPLSQSWHNKFI